MEKIVLKAGDQFYQKWSGLQKPMKFYVLSRVRKTPCSP